MSFRPKDTQERVNHRLKIARGHLDKVISMVDNNEYCIDVLHQLQAVGKGLKETENVIMENHLRTCAVEAINEGETDKAIEEIMSVFKKVS